MVLPFLGVFLSHLIAFTVALLLSAYALASFIAIFINFIFAVFVLLKNPRHAVNQLWSLSILCVILWGTGEFIMRVTQEYSTADTINRISGIGFTLLPSFFFHFALEFSERREILRWHWTHFLIYAPAVVFSALQISGYITTTIYLSWGFAPTPFVGYWPYIVWLEILFLASLALCYQKLRAGKDTRERKQALFVILGVSIPLLIGSFFDAFFPLFGIQTPRIAVVTTTATAGFVTYAVIKFQLMALTPETTATAILNTMSDLLCVVDANGDVIFSNEAFASVFHPIPQSHQMHAKDFIVESERITSLIWDKERNGSSHLVEAHYRTERGDVLPVILSVSRIAQGEKLLGFVLLAHDITRRKKSEDALHISEQRYSMLFENANDVIFTLDMEGRVTSINRIFEKETGWSRDDWTGKPFASILHPEDVRTAWLNFRKSLRGEASPTYELRVMSKWGEYLIGEFTISPEFRDGRVIGLLGIVRNITERRKAEEKIREQAAFIDNAQDAIYVLDLEHRIIFWNASAERLYKWTANEILGRNSSVLFKGFSPSAEEAEKAAQGRHQWIGELHQVTKNGSDVTVQSRWTLMNDKRGNPKSILVINTDITEKKILEQQILRAQRMESLGTLVGGVAHDLNNILSPILLSVQSLKAQDMSEERRREILETIEASASRGAALVKQVLSLGRGLYVERVELQPRDAITAIEKIVRPILPRSINMAASTADNLFTIMADATQLEQVLLNFCLNARDAMPHGGTLRIEARNSVVDERIARLHPDAKTGKYVLLSVSDTGTGIPHHIIQRIFEPFYTTKGIGKGTGLGLSTVLTIVRSFGGFIDVDSEVGRGSTFKVYLPAASMKKERFVAVEEKPLPGGNGELILVIDDEASVREITKETLETYGYRILTAKDLKEGVEQYKQMHREVALVLLDSSMPHVHRTAAIQELRKINPKTRIVSVSGSEESKSDVGPEGIQAVLAKPYTAEKLLTMVKDLLVNP